MCDNGISTKRKEDDYMTIKIYMALDEVLKEADISTYQLQQAGIRLATVIDMQKNRTKSIRFESAERLLNAINDLATNGKTYHIGDIIKSERTESNI